MHPPEIKPFSSLPPVSDFVLVRYVGPNKISAIKAVRNMFWIGLREAKDMVEWPGGFKIPRAMFDFVQAHYCSTSLRDHYAENWKIGEVYPPIVLQFK